VSRIDDELASLRVRAYGPEADIWSDPVALARLTELEEVAQRAVSDGRAPGPSVPRPERAAVTSTDALEALFQVSAPTERESPSGLGGAEPGTVPRPRFRVDRGSAGTAWEGARPPAVPVTAGAAGSRGAARSPAGSRDAGNPDPAGPSPDVDAHPPTSAPTGGDERSGPTPPALPVAPALTRRTRLAWVASLGVAIVLAAGLTAWLFPLGVREEFHHDARMQVRADGASEEALAQLGGAEPSEVRYFGAYKGLDVYATPDCLQAVFDPRQGAFFGGCAADGLDPIMDVYVPAFGENDTSYTDIQFPEEMRRDFPEGGMIRFRLDGDEVLVDEGRRATPEETTES
jgi:hypothetical protein